MSPASDGALHGTLAIGASTGPGGTVVATLLCEFQQRHPGLHVALSVFDTQRVVELVAERELELGVVGARAAPPRRRSSSRSSGTRSSSSARPATPRRADDHARRTCAASR